MVSGMTDLPIGEIEHRSHAMTKSGQPCRNRPLDGQHYCRIHAALAGAPAQAVANIDEPPIDEALQIDEEIPITNAADERIAGEATVEELEVEIHNHDSRLETRDLAAQVLQLIGENLRRMRPEAFGRAVAMIRENISSDYLDPDFWRGISMVLRYQVD